MTWLVPLGPGLTKISVLLFYKRIFLGVFFRFASWVLLILSVIWTVAFFFATFRECSAFLDIGSFARPAKTLQCIPSLSGAIGRLWSVAFISSALKQFSQRRARISC